VDAQKRGGGAQCGKSDLGLRIENGGVTTQVEDEPPGQDRQGLKKKEGEEMK